MKNHKNYPLVFRLSFFAVLIGVPVILFTVVPVFIEKLEIDSVFLAINWITVSSVLLQFWVFCRWSGEGPGKVWKPVVILHALIIPGMYGKWVISTLNWDVPDWINWDSVYWVWGIGSLLLSLWFSFTKSFAVFAILKKQSRLLVIPGLIFLPIIFSVVLSYVYLISQGI